MLWTAAAAANLKDGVGGRERGRPGLQACFAGCIVCGRRCSAHAAFISLTHADSHHASAVQARPAAACSEHMLHGSSSSSVSHAAGVLQLRGPRTARGRGLWPGPGEALMRVCAAGQQGGAGQAGRSGRSAPGDRALQERPGGLHPQHAGQPSSTDCTLGGWNPARLGRVSSDSRRPILQGRVCWLCCPA